ncbi:unnamed protein product, partial [Vitis vinifera]
MIASKPRYHHRSSLVKQVLAAMVQNCPLDASPNKSCNQPWTTDSVSEVLRSIPRLFFQSPRSIGRQKGFRHRSPLKQRNLYQEPNKFHRYRDPHKVKLGVEKAMEFYSWVETQFGFSHNEMTCREMGCVLARGNRLKVLWEFLHEMARKGGNGVVTTATITCLMKVLGEEGLANQALAAFYRMKQFHCKPDVYAYNTIIYALCRVGNFRKARFLLEQMELPGFRCPPDSFTYTILIGSYCKYSLQTGCRKAVRRRLWEANHLFRIMLYYSAVNEIDKAVDMLCKMKEMNHGIPTTSSYTPIIHALCETGRILEARDFLIELVDGGSVPREYTYKVVCDSLRSAGEANMLGDELRGRIENGIENRYKQVMKVKLIMTHRISL